MKCIYYFKIISIGLLFFGGSCQKDDIIKLSDCNLENVVKSVSNTKGTIWYDHQAQSYAVYTGVDGSYDSQIIGLICNLPDMYKSEGLKISFSGDYYECEEFSPLIPGQEYFYLELTNIESDSEE